MALAPRKNWTVRLGISAQAPQRKWLARLARTAPVVLSPKHPALLAPTASHRVLRRSAELLLLNLGAFAWKGLYLKRCVKLDSTVTLVFLGLVVDRLVTFEACYRKMNGTVVLYIKIHEDCDIFFRM